MKKTTVSNALLKNAITGAGGNERTMPLSVARALIEDAREVAPVTVEQVYDIIADAVAE